MITRKARKRFEKQRRAWKAHVKAKHALKSGVQADTTVPKKWFWWKWW